MAEAPRPIPITLRVAALERTMENEFALLRSALTTGLGNLSTRIDAIATEIDSEVRAQLVSVTDEAEGQPSAFGEETRLLALLGKLERARAAREAALREAEIVRRESIRVQRAADDYRHRSEREQRNARRALWAAVLAFATAFATALGTTLGGLGQRAIHHVEEQHRP